MRTNKPTYKTDQWQQQQHSSVYIDTFRNIFHAKTGMSFWVLVVSFFSLSLHFFLYNWTSFLLRKSFFFQKNQKKTKSNINFTFDSFLNNTKNQSIYQRISHQMISQLVTFKKKNGLLILLFTIFLFNSYNLDYHPYY